jgi:hypothetical protein
VLSLALAYNDYKTTQWILHTAGTTQPDAVNKTPANGEWVGIRLHAWRLSMATLHELLNALETADKQGMLKDKVFQSALGRVSASTRREWLQLIDLARGKAHRPLHKYLLKVRNNLVSHYYNPKMLSRGYRDRFIVTPKNEFNTHALASLGPTLRASRFFFADAGVEAAFFSPRSFERT